MASTKLMLDTNIVSYLMKGGVLARAYEPELKGSLLTISFITVGELYYGAENRNWGKEKCKSLENILRQFLVVPYDNEIAKLYGRLMVERNRMGNPIAPNDAWIAACAIRHSIPLVTHNPKDFKGISNLQVITRVPNIL